MIEDMRAELAKLAAKIERKKKIESMLQSLYNEERDLFQHEQCLKATLFKEEADVGRLERTTATSILYSMLGKKDTKIDKEQQEVCVVKLKYDAAMLQLDDCKMRIDALYRERDSISDCADQYNQVFTKLKEMLREDSSYAEQLCALEQQHGQSESQLKELDEAILAGNAAMQQIESIEESLASADGWGTWDLLGGGLISDLAKHSHLDGAQAGVEQLQVLLSRFHTELADVYTNTQLDEVNVGGFLRFADYFFDGLIADWSVLSHIHDSQKRVNQIKQQVYDVLLKLSTIKTVRIEENAAIEKQLAEFVMKG